MGAAAALKVVAVALALSLDVFAVCVGIGVRGVPARARLRLGIVFASSEVGMNLIGAALGFELSHVLGNAGAYIGFAALTGLGIYMIVESRRQFSESSRLDLAHGWGLALAAISLSLDSLGIGFTILYIGVPPEISLTAIAVVSVCSTTLGLALGKRIGRYAERHAALLAGVMLALTGIGFAALKALGLT